MKKEKNAALHYEQIFGKGNFFLELQDHGIPEQRTVNQQLMRLSQEIGIDLVATNDVHYTYAEDEKPHDIHALPSDREKARRRGSDAL